LRSDSPAINSDSAADAPADDFDGRPRDARPDIGAYEFWQPVARVYPPLVVKIEFVGQLRAVVLHP